jgi:O-acetyl-ADP-ribose deacetylase (regulator of RNase III)|tara:strand:- start:1374 stop:1928 length:555 start_codon:yes stop_codon:yes gene_type:complete
MQARIGETKLLFSQGDITDQNVDVIVNAANPSLMGGGGVDGAIHRKGGAKILEDCKRIRVIKWPNGLPVSYVVLSTGGNLKARFVAHTVGPTWKGGNRDEARLLADAYSNSLDLATTRGFESIAFPSISTGAYGYPIEEAGTIALKSVRTFLMENASTLKLVAFVLFSQDDLRIYEEVANEIFA